MNSSKEAILGRVRKALAKVPENERPKDVNVPREYRQKGGLPSEKVIALFAERADEYKATVKRIRQDVLKSEISEACHRENIQKLVVPQGLHEAWLPDVIELLHDTPDSPLTHQDLDATDGVITTCVLAVAQTGTIILDAGPGQGRRVLTLLPDYHLCIVREEQIVELVPEAIAHFESSVQKKSPPITLISGPSATSDIELSRVEGVHGPRRLEILITSFD